MSVLHTKNPIDVVVVEDSPTQAAQLVHILERNGYSARLARNGQEALACLHHHPPKLVITDVMMPVMNGYQLCRAIRDDPGFRNIPVILLSSLSDAEDVIKGLECGADNFITKPYDESYLLSRIEYIFANWHLRDADKSVGLEIHFAGRKHLIKSDRLQILNLLLSTYETAVQKNSALSSAQEELRKLNESLEQRVADRTRALSNQVAERKKAEDEVRTLNAELEARVLDRTAQLEVLNKELEAFGYSVSHDLRAPLRAIGAYAQFLSEDCGKSLNPEACDYIERICESVRRMNKLIEDLLKLFGVTSGRISRQPVNLSDLAQAIADELRRSQPERNVEVVIAPNAIVSGDESLLRVALENLLNNAWKFTARKENARIEFGITEEAGAPAYYVRDNGAGFDMAYANNLFVPFRRLHSGAEFSGTGIGLASVKRIVDRHGGRIWADGLEGEGATFYFTL